MDVCDQSTVDDLSVATAGGATPRVAGLSAAEVLARRAAGLGNTVTTVTSRSTASIIAANVLTRFNVLLGALLVVILVVGPIQDALFGLVLVINTPIGIVQELRAKRVLDRLTVLTAPTARVRRGGNESEVPVADLVVDDVVELRSGDQVAVDGEVVAAAGLEVDESEVTGESAPAVKVTGDAVLSGTVVVAGGGLVRATRVGGAAYANALAHEARRYAPVRSELQRGIDRFLLVIAILIVPLGTLLVVSQVAANDTAAEAIRSSVSGLVAMIPEGLVLLTSVVFAVAAVRLGRRGIVAQELASVEMIARSDVVCFDKTGTLTDGRIEVERVIAVGNSADPGGLLGAVAGADPHPNATLAAIAAAFPSPHGVQMSAVVPFSSARRWSAATVAGRGSWVLGAPDLLLRAAGDSSVRDAAVRLAADGRRVVVFGRTTGPLSAEAPPPDIDPAALVVLRERLRPDAEAIVAYYRDQGLAMKVMSGDHPATVAALATAVGIPGAATPLSGDSLPTGPALTELVEAHAVFGRVSPQQKRALVQALQSRGHVVAMTGDGVNDVLALKQADIGIAMGSGTPATRAVAQITLVDDSFAAVPFAIAEGRRAIANLERVASFFLTKTVYAMVLAIAVSVRTMPFPLLPRQLSLIGLLAVGVPAFVLSFAPSAEHARSGFVRRTLSFAIPAGLVAGVASYLAFEVALSRGTATDESRTVATVVMLAIGLWIVARVARPLRPWKAGLVAAMAAGVAIAFAVPALRVLYGLTPLGASDWRDCLLVGMLAVGALEALLRIGPGRRTVGAGARSS